MSEQEARDTIAELLGWTRRKYHICQNWPGQECWGNSNGKIIIGHPIPNTIDFVSKAWPDECGHRAVSEMMPDLYGLPSHDVRREEMMRAYQLALEYLRDNDRSAFDAAVEKARQIMEKYNDTFRTI